MIRATASQSLADAIRAVVCSESVRSTSYALLNPLDGVFAGPLGVRAGKDSNHG